MKNKNYIDLIDKSSEIITELKEKKFNTVDRYSVLKMAFERAENQLHHRMVGFRK